MFEVGFTEIILILGIALLVLGPEKLPKVAADVGRWMGRARAMARQLRTQLDDEAGKRQSMSRVSREVRALGQPPSSGAPRHLLPRRGEGSPAAEAAF